MAARILNVEARGRFKQRLIFGFIFKPLRLFCDHCDRYVPSDLVWQCGHCDHTNTWSQFYSFLHKCQKCKRAPRSYGCPHCEKINFLDSTRSGSHPARKPPTVHTEVPLPSEAAKDSVSERRKREYEERKEEIERAIVLEALNAKLTQLKASSEFRKQKTAREKLEESFNEHSAHVMGARIIAREQRVKNAETYKADPDLLSMANEAVDHWEEGQL